MTNQTTAPDAGHAAETMSNGELIATYGVAFSLLERNPTDPYRKQRERMWHDELLRRLNTAPARTAGTEMEPCLWCDGTGQEWSSSAKYKRVPCRYCKATGMTTPALNAEFKGEEPVMTPTQSPTPPKSTEPHAMPDEPYLPSHREAIERNRKQYQKRRAIMTESTELRAAARDFAALLIESLRNLSNGGDEYATELLQETLHYIRLEHGDAIDLDEIFAALATIAPTDPGRVVIDASDARWIDSHLCAALHMQPEGEYRTEMEGVWRRVMAIVDQPATITPTEPDRVVISVDGARAITRWMIQHNVAGDPTDLGYAGHRELVAAIAAAERAATGEM